MKKIATLVLAGLLTMAVFLAGCNRQIIDTTYTFDKCIIQLPNGEIIEGEIDSWKDYDDGDQIQVKVNGKIYLVHSSNIVLIKD